VCLPPRESIGERRGLRGGVSRDSCCRLKRYAWLDASAWVEDAAGVRDYLFCLGIDVLCHPGTSKTDSAISMGFQ